jgi:hypothetical protein
LRKHFRAQAERKSSRSRRDGHRAAREGGVLPKGVSTSSTADAMRRRACSHPKVKPISFVGLDRSRNTFTKPARTRQTRASATAARRTTSWCPGPDADVPKTVRGACDGGVRLLVEERCHGGIHRPIAVGQAAAEHVLPSTGSGRRDQGSRRPPTVELLARHGACYHCAHIGERDGMSPRRARRKRKAHKIICDGRGAAQNLRCRRTDSSSSGSDRLSTRSAIRNGPSPAKEVFGPGLKMWCGWTILDQRRSLRREQNPSYGQRQDRDLPQLPA